METRESRRKSGWEKTFLLSNVFVQLSLSGQRCLKTRSPNPPEQAPDPTPLRNDGSREAS